ncbi:MAG TPA: TIGR04282 family arsenosugar biosynthesis glycosyltransferase [Rhodopila sp.]|uniref:TIGR04282 family arsenosugar biosynthesis glycosyltransferase n=1 Tax=Rhodopila sp. TaxID=2480087 RepID=UPI002C39CF3A|nr:TIGR04282 family arsenosugar biosynthesis glycosyltransferase [Rhodopila sp.]HVY14885.1 TIGR04282 family arsenosugar biosynthesis glycosyltransferase [Rhodopila sp.]
MRDTVIVFARAPRLGAVKRRLARDIGDRAALRFHVATLTALLNGLICDGRFDVVLAQAPDRARFRLSALARPVRRIGQGRGDLGARMNRCLRPFRRVVLMGADIPLASAVDVAAAFRRLGTADAVFGPARDGGYWLIALGPRRPADLFGHTRWSTEHALADTLRQFRRHRVAFLRTLSDVDTIEDWRATLVTSPSGGHSAPPTEPEDLS